VKVSQHLLADGPCLLELTIEQNIGRKNTLIWTAECDELLQLYMTTCMHSCNTKPSAKQVYENFWKLNKKPSLKR